MGTAKEKANQYNAKIPPKERKTYDRKIRIVTMVSLLFFLFGVSFLISNRPMMEELYIGDSKYFSRAEVESYTKNIIDYLDENNYTALKEHSRPEMHEIFTEDKLNEAKDLLLDITEDGMIDESEKPQLEKILGTLDELEHVAQSLKVWVKKNL